MITPRQQRFLGRCGFLTSSRTRGRARHQQRQLTINYLKSERGCAVCGCKDIDQLVWHHVDPVTKLFDVSSMTTHAWWRVEAEMLKCEVLCHEHHRERHREMRSCP